MAKSTARRLIPKIKLIKPLHEELHMPAKRRRTKSMSVTAVIHRAMGLHQKYNKT